MSPARLPPLDELVNALEFEEPAKLALDPAVYATIAGGERAAFERITFRPRMMVPTLDLDLTVDLFGDSHFTPIVVGPVAEQRRIHRDGELATVRGAAAARAAVVVTNRSSVPVADLSAQAAAPLWYAVYDDADPRKRIDEARAAGCRVACITLQPASGPNWRRLEAACRGLAQPFVIKGVTTPRDARTAIDLGASGVIVSDHGGGSPPHDAPVAMLPAIVEACSGGAVLVDGGFRRGSDIVKALALGAHGVLVARPIMWGLAAYGADGVRAVLELLQSDVARTMGALGAPSLKHLTPETIRIHRR